MTKKLSVVLAVFNEEKNIKECLDSVKDFAEEIIVVDGSSTDKTVESAKKFNAKVFVVPNKLMFHENKQLALEKASNDWILQLDADERITSPLGDEIRSVINQPGGINAYYIPRKNWFLTRFLKKGGQYPDYVIRLVRKGKAIFPCKTVHEQIKVKGKIGYLKNDLIHLANPDLKSYFKKFDIYTNETALRLKNEKVKKNFWNVLLYLIIKPTKTFINIFIRHKGFVDGLPGFIFALFSGFHFFVSFIKYWEKE